MLNNPRSVRIGRNPQKSSNVPIRSNTIANALNRTLSSCPGHVHFIGIGGSGLSPLALLASDQGWSVSGSDQAFASPQLDLLREKGVTVVAGGQRAETIERLLSTSPPNPIYVVASSAVKSDNPELQAAVKHGLSVLKRDQWLPVFTAGKRVLAVSGTHGKTTTTALLSYLLWKVNQELGGVQDPCCTRSLMAVVGGNVSQFPTGSGALSWRGASDGTAHDGAARDDFVIEADEYDRAFLGLSPYISIVLNVDHDHVDCYPTPVAIQEAFTAFCGRSDPAGVVLLCAEDTGSAQLHNRLASSAQASTSHTPTYLRYGFDSACDIVVECSGTGSSFTLRNGTGAVLGVFTMQLRGRHNVLNAAAAITAAALSLVRRRQESDSTTPSRSWRDFLTRKDCLMLIQDAMNMLAPHVASFQGVGRRQQLLSTRSASSPIVYDDYAHHPTEIRATLSALRDAHPHARIVAVFQPHTFTRLSHFIEGFADSLSGFSAVYVLPVFGAREDDTRGDVLRTNLQDQVRDRGIPCTFIDLSPAGAQRVFDDVMEEPGVVVVVMGAGDSTEFAKKLAQLAGEHSARQGFGASSTMHDSV